MVKSDRISNLPEALISHILSLLPTKCAVATSVLSTTWKLQWTSLSNIDLELELDSGKFGVLSKREVELKSDKFTRFVNRVLLLLDPPSIRKLRLSCVCEQEHFNPSDVTALISTAFGYTIRELNLKLVLDKHFELPLSHNYCHVTVLKLEGRETGSELNIDFNISATSSVCFPNLQTLSLHWLTFAIDNDSSVSFPSLKNLHLECVDYAYEDFLHRLFSRCPVLEDLVFEKECWDDAIYLIIRIPSLKSLTVHFKADEYYIEHRILIDTPALQYLDINDELTHLAGKNLSSVVQAKVRLNFDEDSFDVADSLVSFSSFLTSLSKVKFLSVSGYVLMAFRIAPVNISEGFHNLTWLEIDVDDCVDFSVVNNFLERMDNLEHLVMEGCVCSRSHQSWWTEPLNVPKCLLSRVTTISLSCMSSNCCDQHELLTYFLKNAEVLQLMTISSRPISKKDPLEVAKDELEFVKKISMVPRGSRACQVAFS